MSPSSPSPKPLSILITKGNIEGNKDQSVMNKNMSPNGIKLENQTDEKSILINSNLNNQQSIHTTIETIEDQKLSNSPIVRTTVQIPNFLKKGNDDKYTFVPIQLPASCSTSNILSNNSNTGQMSNLNYETVQTKLSSSLTTSTNSSFYSLVQKNNNLSNLNSIQWSTKNSFHESSNSSNNTKLDLADSITTHLNSDLEPCI
jgi:hypothetical protein